MRYLLAILIPPLAVLLCGKPIRAILNIFLCAFFILPGIIHAFRIVHAHLARKRLSHRAIPNIEPTYSEGLICQSCGSRNWSTINTRRKGNCIMRRRECQQCGHRVTTYEAIIE